MPSNRRQLFVVACFLVTLVISPVSAADWPTYLSNSSRTGEAGESLKAPFKAGWVYSPPSTPRRSFSGAAGRTIEGKVLRDRVRYDDAFHVAVVGDRLYFGSSADHKVYCRDAKTGKELWSFFTGGPVRLAPTVAGGKVYFGSDDGQAYCLDANSGKLVWKLRAGPAEEWLIARGDMISRWPVRTGVLVDDGVAYFTAGIFPHEDIYLYAVDADSGKIIWKQDNISESEAGRNDLSPQGYLLASKTTLFVPSGRTLPAAIDRKTGKLLHKSTASWRREGGGVVGGTRGVLADGQLYAGNPHHYLAIDQKTGKVGFAYFDGKQMAIAGDAAYTATGAFLSRLNRLEAAATSRELRKLESDIYNLSRKISGANKKDADTYRAQIATAQQKIKAIENQGVVWKVPADHEAALIVAGDVVIAGGDKLVTAFDSETGKELWSAKVEGAARGLAVSNGRLFVSTTTGHIYSFTDSDTEPAETAPVKPLVKNPY
ncbi:MAG: PQQ-binding-like beta-propeller repeat protein, partial [Planctomycetes bacterium]|nr:PQQ-binding-like beta-propeller repeat protein [Planctomycetota bacterium]